MASSSKYQISVDTPPDVPSEDTDVYFAIVGEELMKKAEWPQEWDTIVRTKQSAFLITTSDPDLSEEQALRTRERAEEFLEEIGMKKTKSNMPSLEASAFLISSVEAFYAEKLKAFEQTLRGTIQQVGQFRETAEAVEKLALVHLAQHQQSSLQPSRGLRAVVLCSALPLIVGLCIAYWRLRHESGSS